MPIGFESLPERVTLLELQRVHEEILGRALNKDSFRGSMLASGGLHPRLANVRPTSALVPPSSTNTFHRAAEETRSSCALTCRAWTVTQPVWSIRETIEACRARAARERREEFHD